LSDADDRIKKQVASSAAKASPGGDGDFVRAGVTAVLRHLLPNTIKNPKATL
jgi:hypothetical protein